MLTILVEKGGGKNPNFSKSSKIEAKFNPNHLKFVRSASWEHQKAAQRDVPELQFTGANPRTLNVELMFDTYDSEAAPADKQPVTELTDPLLYLTTVEKHGDKHRPPVCRLSWGRTGIFFQGVLTNLDIDLTLFTEFGVPVRAKVGCTFTEWRADYEDLNRQNKQSSDVAKVWVVGRGDTLASIAAHEYADARYWRAIADANDIDDPLQLEPGRSLALPAIGATRIQP